MTAKYLADGLNLNAELLDYVRRTAVRESPTQAKIRTATAEDPNSQMMVSPEQGSAMELIFRMLRPTRIIEVGVFTGYSATWLAAALQEGGELVACDVSEEYLEVATSFWKEAGVADRVRGVLGPAADSLQTFLAQGWAGTVDAIFVDADKTGYATYYELGFELLRPGGLMLFDNVLWSGQVLDPSDDSPDTVALREVVAHATNDGRVHSALLTDGDGLLAVMKPW
jgi:predicted O-methyltransferase YrrM